VRPDLVAVDNPRDPREYLGKFWLDSLVHDEMMLEYLIRLVGANRIALGTDYPFPLGELEPGKMIETSRFDAETKAQMLHGAALEWLALDKNSYV
jgi:aminocarboxymuconate-semialdehyde decarboxylase